MLFKKTFLIWIIGIGVILIFLPSFSQLQELKDRNVDLEEKIKRLQTENELLQQELKRIVSDSFYQEKITREKMGVVRKDEIPVKIIPEEKQ